MSTSKIKCVCQACGSLKIDFCLDGLCDALNVTNEYDTDSIEANKLTPEMAKKLLMLSHKNQFDFWSCNGSCEDYTSVDVTIDGKVYENMDGVEFLKILSECKEAYFDMSDTNMSTSINIAESSQYYYHHKETFFCGMICHIITIKNAVKTDIQHIVNRICEDVNSREEKDKHLSTNLEDRLEEDLNDTYILINEDIDHAEKLMCVYILNKKQFAQEIKEIIETIKS